jgi:hypothetical protein
MLAIMCAAPLAAQGAAGIVRTKLGLRYEIPDGWEWGGFDGNKILIQDLATKKDGSSPNNFTVNSISSHGDGYDKGWSKTDRDEQQTFPNGAKARWRAGPRFGNMYAFVGEATLGTKALKVDVVDSITPTIDVSVVEAAFVRIVKTLREVPASSSIYHPSLGIAGDPLKIESWFTQTGGQSLAFRCWRNGRSGDGYIRAFPAEAFPDVSKALAGLTGYLEKNMSLKIGASQSATIPGGEVSWTEQPGSQYPFLGAVQRGGSYIYVTAVATPDACTAEVSREDFLAVAKSVRVWDGN